MCAMYGGARDTSFKIRINRNFINKTVSEEVVYYKLSLPDTQLDIYGDAIEKMYLSPVLLTCLVYRNPQEMEHIEAGTNVNRSIDFAFLKEDLYPLNVVPEPGDIIKWNESYFEVDIPVEDQLIVGKDPNYSLESGLEKFGNSLSIICKSHLTHVNRLNIIESR